MPTVAFTVDLDPTPAYYAIHGLQWNGGADPIFQSGLRRLIDLLKEEGIPATLFVTGGTLGPAEWALLRDAAAAGCELADHSFSHDYRLSLRPQEDIVTDLKRNSFALRENTGITPRGFRAPGYNTSPAMLAALREMGYRYDSSRFPSLFYNAAKQLLIWIKRLMGKRSVSFVGSFRDSFGPQSAYMIEEGLVELPITTLFPPVGLPLIGTALITFPAPLVHLMVSRALKRDFALIEMHAIDFAETADGIELRPLSDRQPDLAHGIDRKLKRIRRTIQRFKERGFTFETLGAIADRHQ
ncbi:MAG TPA: polysaccharide deacetylase family protein [bacterium]|nr:polysaccharide deacetylase family protein [bacterium]